CREMNDLTKQRNSLSLKEWMKTPEMLTLIGFIILCIFFSVASQEFLSMSNLSNIVRQVSINGILAVGMTFVILTGGIDLSVGSVMALTGTIMAGMMISYGLPPIVAVLIGMVLGAVIGFINGAFTAYARIPGIIVTLAMMEMARGAALLYTGGYPLSGLPSSYSIIGKGYLFGIIPMPAVIMIIVFFIAYIILNHLP